MIDIIVTLLVIVLGYYLTVKTRFEDTGMAICIIGVFCGLFHNLAISQQSRYYEEYSIERNAFIETLNNSRKLDGYENAALTLEIIKANKSLALKKYKNKRFIIGYYVDDRYEQLEPIK